MFLTIWILGIIISIFTCKVFIKKGKVSNLFYLRMTSINTRQYIEKGLIPGTYGYKSDYLYVISALDRGKRHCKRLCLLMSLIPFVNLMFTLLFLFIKSGGDPHHKSKSILDIVF